MARRIAFMHIPKTGGIALERAIERSCRPSLSVCPAYFTHQYAGKTYSDLGQYDFFKGHFNFDFLDSVPSEYYKITVVRNPIDLLISLYNHIATRPKHHLHTASQEKTFSCLIKENPGTHNILSKYILGKSGYDSVKDGLSTGIRTEGDVWSMAKTNLSRFDQVGLTKDLGKFTKTISIDLDQEIEAPLRENASSRTIKSRSNISEEEMQALEDVTHIDRLIYKNIEDFLISQSKTV